MYTPDSIRCLLGSMWNREQFIQLMELSLCTLTSLFRLKMPIMYNTLRFYLQFNNKWLLWNSARIATVNQQDPYQTTEAMK